MKKYFYVSAMVLATMLSAQSCIKSPVKNCDPLCEVNGTCNLVTGTCDCNEGYEGVNCEIETRARFLGTYAVKQDSSGVIKNYTCIIANGSGNAYTISLSSLNNASFNATVAKNNTVTIEDFNAEFIQISGSGNLNGNTLTLNVNFKPNFDPAYTLLFTLTKQ